MTASTRRALRAVSGRLRIIEVPMPRLGPKDTLVRVRASGVNRADLAQIRRALDGDDAALPLGREIAGEIESIGSEVDGWRPGHRVMAMSTEGFADRIVVPDDLLIPTGPDWEWPEAASIPVAFMTAHNALTSAGRLTAGEAVLVTGASSVVGAVAVTTARHLGAGTVTGVVRSPSYVEQVMRFGASSVIVDESPDSRTLSEAAPETGFDVIVDLVGGSILPASVEAMNVGGRLISVGRLGNSAGILDLGGLARKRAEIIGVSFSSRNLTERAAVAQAMWKDLRDALVSRLVHLPPIRPFDVERAELALTHVDGRRRIEKTVLTWGT